MHERRALSQRQLTYDTRGATLAGNPLATATGYRGYVKSVNIGDGEARWEFASTEVLRWGIKTRSGFTVLASHASDRMPRVTVDRRYWLVAHLGPFRIREPIQVIAVIDEPDRKGFAYGTLSGHPVSGEEAFIVNRRPDGSVWLTIRSITGPKAGVWRFAGPTVGLAQRCYRRRYLRALTGPI
jgi:uncharacterized protein (UPF0548 family)